MQEASIASNANAEEEEIAEPLTIAEENPWTNEVTTNNAPVVETGSSKAGRIKKAVNAAKEGFSVSLWKWADTQVGAEVLEGLQMVREYSHDTMAQLGDGEEVADAVRRGKDKRMVLVSFAWSCRCWNYLF